VVNNTEATVELRSAPTKRVKTDAQVAAAAIAPSTTAASSAHAVGRRKWLSTAHAAGASTTIRAVASDPSITLPIAVLLLFAIAVGAVNFARWGNPFTFVDFRYYYWGLRHANFLGILQNYGEINLGRMWIGALYYATGIPYLVKGVHPFAEFLDSRMAAIEARRSLHS
jgi:hypothetical protein